MFDLSSAVVLGLVLMGLTSLVHTAITGTNKQRLTVLVTAVVSLAAVLLVGASDFAHEQVLLSHPLDQLNIWSQVLIAVLAAGTASATWEIGSKAISNIGQNQVKTTTPAPSDDAPAPQDTTTPGNGVVFND
jgi:hypothetical protein